MSEWNWCWGAQNAAVSVKPQDREGGGRGGGHTQGDLPFHIVNSYAKLLEQENFYIRKEFNLHRTVWNTNMAPLSLFWNTNLADMTSCENALFPWGIR